MSSFDYKKAWQDIARPQYLALPREAKDLFKQVIKECRDLKQARETLELPFPDTDLRSKMEAMDNYVLAHAAQVIYNFGYWSGIPVGNGASWKFANLADQILRERHNVLNGDGKKRTGILIHEGYVRIFYSTSQLWMWREAGPATYDIVRRAKLITQEPRPSNVEVKDWVLSAVNYCKLLCNDDDREWMSLN